MKSEYRVFWKDDSLVGVRSEMISYLKDMMKNAVDNEDSYMVAMFDVYLDLIRELREADDNDLVIAAENPMGGWDISHVLV